LPIATGIGPEMALFCSNLHIYASMNRISAILLKNYAITAQQKQKVMTYTDCRLVRLPIDGDRVPDKL